MRMARLEIRIFKKEKNGSLRRQIELLEAEIDGAAGPGSVRMPAAMPTCLKENREFM